MIAPTMLPLSLFFQNGGEEVLQLIPPISSTLASPPRSELRHLRASSERWPHLRGATLAVQRLDHPGEQGFAPFRDSGGAGAVFAADRQPQAEDKRQPLGSSDFCLLRKKTPPMTRSAVDSFIDRLRRAIWGMPYMVRDYRVALIGE